jgi:glycosyltransferase involved in cell wall biosynthesis
MKRLHPGKGVYDAIRIWERVCREVENAKLVLAGSSTERIMSHVKEMIKRKGLEKNIEYLGILYNLDKKFTVLKQSRMLIHPSYAENWGIVIGESMACGTPVLFYDLPVLRDIWKRGSIGIRTGDIDDFAQTVINLLRDKKTLAKLSKEATDYARQFDWDIVAEKEMKILENL